MSKNTDETTLEVFELETVKANTNKFGGSLLLPQIQYTIPPIPIFGEHCANPDIKNSHALTHPAIYFAKVSDYKMIGGTAFPIIQNKCIHHQNFSTEIWETWEQAIGVCSIRQDQNLIGYGQLKKQPTQNCKIINLVGNGSYNYAHWLTEFLPQLVLLKKTGIDLSNYKVLIDARSFPSMLEALFLLGIKNEQLIRVEALSLHAFPHALWVSPVANIVFQRPNALTANSSHQLAEPQHAIFHPEVLQTTRETFLKLIDKQPSDFTPEKIFIKRTPGRTYHARSVLNEAEIQNALELLGFVSIDPSLLTFTEQIRQFSHAKFIVAASGAALVNMIWAPADAKVIVLMNDSKVANYWYFSNIAFALGHQLGYVLGKVVDTGCWDDINHADFKINTQTVLAALRHFGFETKSFREREKSTPKNKKIRILFVLQLAVNWSSLGSVWRALSAYPNVELKLINTKFIHPATDFSDDNWAQLNTFSTDMGLAVDTSGEKVITTFQPHLVFLPNPYDSTRVPELHTSTLINTGCRIAYIPYGIEMGGGSDNLRWQFNESVQQAAWRVFLRSKRNKAMYAKYCDVGDSHAIVTGHPKFDLQQNFATYPISDNLRAKIAGRSVVLWTPHFSVGLHASWSTYRIYNEIIMQQVEARPDLFFIIRPHPLFFKEMLRQQVWQETNETAFRLLCRQKNNLWLDENPDYMEAFAAANGLMTDVGSFLLEFLPTKKPILYLHHPEGLGLNDDSDLVAHYYQATKPEDIAAYIDMVANGADPMQAERIAIIDEYLYGLDGKAGQRIADYVVENLSNELELTEWDTEPCNIVALQNKSDFYWKNAPTTITGASDYYQYKTQALQNTMRYIPELNYAMDIGCGEGAYTALLAQKAKQMDAYDISKKLIQSAKKRAAKLNLENVNFQTQAFTEITARQNIDLISCIELAGSILSDQDFSKLFNKLHRMLKENGYLLILDCFSLQEDQLRKQSSGLSIKLRNIDAFIKFTHMLGFQIDFQTTISESPSDTATRLFLLKKIAPNSKEI
ncbi:MAG: DUF563 domain-containing protein [Methylophilaceae bacterium]|nr:DUF563 domain-containing protein [Methylophilaceae bacterium]